MWRAPVHVRFDADRVLLIGVVKAPGAILAAVVGTILLLLSLYMAAILQVDTMGTLLAVLAIALFAIDVFALAHGMLTGGGIAAFLIGSLALFEGSDPLLRLLRGYIIEGVIVWAASFAFLSAKDFVPSVCQSR